MKEASQENNFEARDSRVNADTDPIRQRCAAEVFNAQAEEREAVWDKVKKDIIDIEKSNFGKNAFPEELLSLDIKNPATAAVFIKDQETGRVVGFTYAEPSDDTEKEGDTALVSDTAIHPEYQHHHLVADLITKLEEELKKRGYIYMERYSNSENGYAAKIALAYKGRIIEQAEPEKSEYGFFQVYFKIKL